MTARRFGLLTVLTALLGCSETRPARGPVGAAPSDEPEALRPMVAPSLQEINRIYTESSSAAFCAYAKAAQIYLDKGRVKLEVVVLSPEDVAVLTARVNELGGEVTTELGGVMFIWLPVAGVERLSDHPRVVRLSVVRPTIQPPSSSR